MEQLNNSISINSLYKNYENQNFSNTNNLPWSK
jgi:hypothetical protein